MAIFNSYVKFPEGIFDKNLAPYPICHGIVGWFHRFSHIFIHIIILLKVKSAICGQNHSSPINFSTSFGMMAIPPKLNHSGRLRPKAVWTYAFGGLGLAVSIRKEYNRLLFKVRGCSFKKFIIIFYVYIYIYI